MKVAARGTAVVLIASGMLVLGACGGGESTSPARGASSNAAAHTTATATTTSTTPTTAITRVAAGVLEPGVYTTAAFQPAITFTVGSGWKVLAEDDDYFYLSRLDSPTSEIGFLRVHSVTRAGVLGPAPSDLVGWLRTNTDLDVGATEVTTVAGRQTTSLDVTMSTTADAATAGPKCGTPCVELFRFGNAFDSVMAGLPARIYVVPQQTGDPVIVQVDGPAARTAADRAAAEAILSTVTFGS